jgi:hypothetical protein
MASVTAAALLFLLAMPSEAQAQQPSANQTHPPAVDPSKMGVSLDRIRRELDQGEVREQRRDGLLSLEFHIEVYGTAPKIDLLKDYPLIGPTPYGAPTHREVIDFLTPEEFRSPAIPFSNLAVWAAQALWNRSNKQRCEEELQEYKRLVMQGVNIAAPRCAQ